MRPKPTTPTFLSSSSTPPYLLRFHAPALRAWLAGAMLRARGQQQADRELSGRGDVGGGGVDDHDPGLGGGGDVHVVETHPGAGDDLEALRGRDRLLVHLRGRAHEHRVDVGQGGQELVAVRAVAVADLEVRAEGIDGGGREFLGDQHDRLGHVSSPSVWVTDGRGTPRPVGSAVEAGGPRGGRAPHCAGVSIRAGAHDVDGQSRDMGSPGSGSRHSRDLPPTAPASPEQRAVSGRGGGSPRPSRACPRAPCPWSPRTQRQTKNERQQGAQPRRSRRPEPSEMSFRDGKD